MGPARRQEIYGPESTASMPERPPTTHFYFILFGGLSALTSSTTAASAVAMRSTSERDPT
jgi:hypothetical protein